MARLTDKGVKNAPAGRHGDGDGLQLVVSASGRRKWILRYQLAGTRRDMGLGSYPSVTLAQARIAAGDARKLIVQGIDPVQARDAAKRAEKPVPDLWRDCPEGRRRGQTEDHEREGSVSMGSAPKPGFLWGNMGAPRS